MESAKLTGLVRRTAAELRLKSSEHLCSPSRGLYTPACSRDDSHPSSRMIGTPAPVDLPRSEPLLDLPQSASKVAEARKNGPISSTGY